MIQRIQTVYLILAVLLTLSVAFTALFDRLLEDPQAWILSAFLAAVAFSSGISVWAVLKFRDRPAQAATVSKAMVFQLIAMGVGVAVFFTMGPINSGDIGEFMGVGLLSVGLLFQLLARIAILKDEKLVKSMDRIR